MTREGDGRQDRALLMRTARTIASDLKNLSRGTALRARSPGRVRRQSTGGWSAAVGNLGKHGPRLEIWLDRFTGHRQRKFYFGLYSRQRRRLENIAKQVARRLWPHVRVTDEDVSEDRFTHLEKRLRRDEFNVTVFEAYESGNNYYGIFEPSKLIAARSGVDLRLCARAAAFFVEVTRVLPGARPENAEADVYPQFENRKAVASHLKRERSRLLATARKDKDKYVCQVCRMRFEKVYGELGRAFAEAHHVVPLSHLGTRAKTRIEDLRTVCANCHRMLHRMDGRRDDVVRLRAIWKRRRR